MKQCPQCFAQNPDNAAFCEHCGADLRNAAAMPGAGSAAPTAPAAPNGPGAWNTAAPTAPTAPNAPGGWNTGSEPQGGGAGGWDTAAETQGYAPNRGTAPQGGNSILVDQSETVVASIGSNYLQNYLSGGSVSKGIGVLTQKRFYYKGKNYSGNGREMKSTTQEGVVSLEDITFTMFTHVRHIGFLLVAVLLTVATAVLPFVFNRDPEIALAAALPAIVFYILYFVKRTSVFQVCFPGGGFGFDIRWYPINDIRDFQRQLHLLKDHRREN